MPVEITNGQDVIRVYIVSSSDIQMKSLLIDNLIHESMGLNKITWGICLLKKSINPISIRLTGINRCK